METFHKDEVENWLGNPVTRAFRGHLEELLKATSFDVIGAAYKGDATASSVAAGEHEGYRHCLQAHEKLIASE